MSVMKFRTLTHCLLLGLAVIGASGCETFDDMLGSSEAPRLPGKRVSVLIVDQKLKVDPAMANVDVTLPPAVTNADWAQMGGNAAHNLGHVALPAQLHMAWSADIGQGLEDHLRFVGAPVMADGKVFVLDTGAAVTAIDASNGKRLWRVRISPQDARTDTLGGGIAYGAGKLYVTAGYPELMALDPANGGMIWRKQLTAPPRAAITYSDERLYLVTLDNQSTVLNAADGAQIWSQAGLPEGEGVLGQASPAVDRTVEVTPYSSGEIFALRIETGRPAWQDNLVSIRHTNALWSLTDISTSPVIDQGQVLAISVGGRFVAIDLRTGQRNWQHEVGSNNMPWVAGDFVYLLDNDTELACFSRKTGGVRWISQLQGYENMGDRKHPVYWRGPVLAGGRLILTNTLGQIVEVSPNDGRVLSTTSASGTVTVAPIVADNTLYILSDDGQLAAYR